jgi:catechol 2,3-dioxygenase-like lactoylglutathione lyase family enzyme
MFFRRQAVPCGIELLLSAALARLGWRRSLRLDDADHSLRREWEAMAMNQKQEILKMSDVSLEHVNFTVSDPEATARWLCEVFGWRVRWAGSSIHGGRTVHVGSDTSYLALYSMGTGLPLEPQASYHRRGGLNHVGITVGDLAATEKRVKATGFEPHSHADYEPGRRFYFNDHDGIEYEVVSYG